MINYQHIQDSITFYEKFGFTRIETPWLVTEEVDAITRPKNVIPYRVDSKNKNLVASGEQGFLYLYLKQYLPKGKFQTTTPCFRNDSFDMNHTKYFIKNELIITDEISEDNLNKLLITSLEFFKQYFSDKNKVKVVSTDIGYDIMIGDDELGSYGIRETTFLKWIYGTGCAEPRLSRLMKKYNK